MKSLLKFNSKAIFILKEARMRVGWLLFSFILTFITCYCVSEDLFFGLATPFFKVSKISSFICTHITESLNTYIIISIILGSFFCIPYMFYQFWCFFIPSCYKHYRYLAIKVVIFSLIALVFALIVTFNSILPNIWLFLYKLSNTEFGAQVFIIRLQPKIYEFSILTLQILFIASLCSQIPIIIVYGVQSNLISITTLIKSRKTGAFISLLFAALITPPDVWCQLSVFLLFFILVEFALLAGIILDQYVYQQEIRA